MAMTLPDRLLTIVATATLVSAGWIVFGSVYLGIDPRPGGEEEIAAPPTPEPPSATATFDQEAGAAAQDTVQISQPDRAQTANLIIPVLEVSADELVDNYSDESRGGKQLHQALDIMAPEGTSVISTAPGTIERLFRSEVGGNTIYVRSDDGETIYYYAHLDEYAPGLREGQKIRRGQRLGTVGSTGNVDSDAPHLHFAILRTTPDAEWWEPATALNPYPLLTGE